MRKLSSTAKLLLSVLIVAALVMGTMAYAKGKPGPRPCNNWDILCPDVWDPVVCDDGVIYSNQCYADRACATGCQPAGGGPEPL